MKPILEINNISKKFLIDHERPAYLSLRDRIAGVFKPKSKQEEFWALKDVSFNVMPGESIGIIGRNGAGKSTLLKILSRITPPTTGEITIRGRIASLLEVGTGFHQELTGRENIFMNGSILGMKRAEIKNKFDEIVDFSGVEKFLDTPLKNYSSGMQLRLAFAVAAHLEPEILIIDEVLAVGDAEFQKRCMGKMEEVQKSGRTILFVSHNLQAVSALTKSSLWMDYGSVKFAGKTNDAIKNYHAIHGKSNLSYKRDSRDTLKPQIKEVTIKTTFPGNIQKHGEQYKIIIKIAAPEVVEGGCVSVYVKDELDRNVLHLWNFNSSPPICSSVGETILECTIPNFRLYMGKYYLAVFFAGPPGSKLFDEVKYVCPFEVVMYNMQRLYDWEPQASCYLEEYSWQISSGNADSK